jgi:EAL domain-containing protein (putative c-di-GMP-specific phosphodiesterase class I)
VPNGPDALRRLAELGVVLGVDDFGTGYASLAYVHDLPLRFIKIDRSFVRGLTNDRKASAIVAGVTRLAEELDVLCVAEGIETVEQRDELARRRVQYGQGYLFGAPMSSADVPALLPPRPAG